MFGLYLLLRRVRIVWVISYLAMPPTLLESAYRVAESAYRVAVARQQQATMTWFVLNLLLVLVGIYCLLSRETTNFAFGRSRP